MTRGLQAAAATARLQQSKPTQCHFPSFPLISPHFPSFPLISRHDFLTRPRAPLAHPHPHTTRLPSNVSSTSSYRIEREKGSYPMSATDPTSTATPPPPPPRAPPPPHPPRRPDLEHDHPRSLRAAHAPRPPSRRAPPARLRPHLRGPQRPTDR